MTACGTGPRLELQRLPGRVVDGEQEGVRGQLRVVAPDGRVLVEVHTLERGPHARWVHLRPGTYRVRMDHWQPRSGGPKRRSLRVLDVYEDHVHVHPANRPRHLEGCIAPGMSTSQAGVERSAEALERVFAELGGYVEGSEFELRVY